jgi:Holliday junction resolvasome RuvABC endonuclease subunit
MGLHSLIKQTNRVIGIDASTNSFAFCVIEDGKAIKWGEIHFYGNNIYDRIVDAKRKIRALKASGALEADAMALEAAVMVRSAATGLKMAYVFGAILGELVDDELKVSEVHPIEWQSYIGNKNFTKAQKLSVKSENPGKSETWIKNRIREMRKQITIDFVKNLGIETDNNNVADAAGIAWFAYNTLNGKAV